jgi:hypothetical protein
MDPTPAIKLVFKTIEVIYHLRLDLKNSQELLTNIKSEITNLQINIEDLQLFTKSRILSQQNFDHLAISYKIYNQHMLEIQHLLSLHLHSHGTRLVDSLKFRFGPRAELMNKIVALNSSVKYLGQRYERYAHPPYFIYTCSQYEMYNFDVVTNHKQHFPLSLHFQSRGSGSLGKRDSRGGHGIQSGQLISGEMCDTLSSASQLSDS